MLPPKIRLIFTVVMAANFVDAHEPRNILTVAGLNGPSAEGSTTGEAGGLLRFSVVVSVVVLAGTVVGVVVVLGGGEVVVRCA